MPQPNRNPAANPTLKELTGIRSELRRLNQHATQFKPSRLDNAPAWLQKFQTYLPLALTALIAIGSLLLLALLIQTQRIQADLATLQAQLDQSPRYEYQVFAPNDLNFTEAMNQQGATGWQALQCRRAQDSVTEDFGYECIMSRPSPPAL